MKRDLARVGVDIGGTFTDVALEWKNQLYSTKVLTNYTSPEQAIIDGIGQVIAKAGISLADIDSIIHGTTLATNSLIERRGAKTALITTKGFRDVIEMRTENRFELYDLNIVIPPALIPRHARFVVEERVNAAGEVILPLNASDVESVVDAILAEGYESIAVGFMHSYLNDEHERAVRDYILSRAPHMSVSISAEVSPQIREFQRFNTVCANAYVKPLMSSYLNRLAGRLKSEGATCPVFMIHSGGGIITVESAAEYPVRLLESGPAGGAIFAAHIAERYNLNRVLSYDMGGTTAKICLIDDRTPKTAKTFEVARTYRFKKGSGMPISIPVIEMIEIGAGGGSIAAVDSMSQIRVGPHSAGSEPGPACYNRGGTLPTITDADLILGRLDPHGFAGGSIVLSEQASHNAIEEHISSKLAIGVDTSAFGICEVVDESMSNAARMHAVENGKELSEYTMIAFGGAAPLHASRLCEKLGIHDLIIPPGAGVGSAIGFLRAPVAFESVKSAYIKISSFDSSKVNNVIDELVKEASKHVYEAAPDTPVSMDLTAYIRYVGQGWKITALKTDSLSKLISSRHTKNSLAAPLIIWMRRLSAGPCAPVPNFLRPENLPSTLLLFPSEPGNSESSLMLIRVSLCRQKLLNVLSLNPAPASLAQRLLLKMKQRPLWLPLTTPSCRMTDAFWSGRKTAIPGVQNETSKRCYR